MTKEELDFLIPVIEATDVYFGISFERPDLQEMSVEQRKKKYKEVGDKVGENDPVNDPVNRTDLLCQLMKDNRYITIPELALKIKVSKETIKRDIESLKEDGIIRRIGPDKGGYWEVIK